MGEAKGFIFVFCLFFFFNYSFLFSFLRFLPYTIPGKHSEKKETKRMFASCKRWVRPMPIPSSCSPPFNSGRYHRAVRPFQEAIFSSPILSLDHSSSIIQPHSLSKPFFRALSTLGHSTCSVFLNKRLNLALTLSERTFFSFFLSTSPLHFISLSKRGMKSKQNAKKVCFSVRKPKCDYITIPTSAAANASIARPLPEMQHPSINYAAKN